MLWYEELVNFIAAYWPAIVTILLIVVALLFVIISAIVSEKADERHRQELGEQSNLTRVYIIDFVNNSVSYFNVRDIKNVHKVSIGDFYRLFPVSQQKRIISWVNNIVDAKDDVPNYIEVDVLNSRGSRKKFFAMLQLTHVDYKKGLIHIESYVLKYMNADKGGHVSKVSSIKQFQDAFKMSYKGRGFSALLLFGFKKEKSSRENMTPIDPVTANQIKNAISPFVTAKRMMVALGPNEIVFSDFRANDRAAMMVLTKSILNAIRRYLAINGLDNEVDVRAGLIEHKACPDDVDQLLAEAARTAEMCYSEQQELSWYEKGKYDIHAMDEDSYRTEVEKIISDKKLSYKFRAIYDVDKAKTIGYFSKAIPMDTYFESIEELKAYAFRTDDDKNLFATIAKNVIPRFVNERIDERQSLFFPLLMEERGYMLGIFARLGNSKDAHLVFLFSESDIKAHLDPKFIDNVVEDMRMIKAKGYQVGILLDVSELSLPSEIYEAFDYFVVSFASKGKASDMDNRIRSELHALVEKLLKYSRPIVATDIEGWNAIELIVRSGVHYISSESFSPYDEMILPLTPKLVKKVNEMKG